MIKKLLSQIIVTSLLITCLTLTTHAQASQNQPNSDLSQQIQENDQTQDNFQQTLDSLLPSETELFGQEQGNFAQGDLEQDVIPRVLRLLIIISGVVITLVFTYVGFRLVLARGDEAQLTNLKNTFTQIVIGTIIILSAFAIVVGIIEFFDALR